MRLTSKRLGAVLLSIASPLVWTTTTSAEPAIAQSCDKPDRALGVSRIVEIDTTTGPIFGSMTKREKEPDFLAPDEVVLTFDDGPVPWITKPILDTLDKFCTKATFFSVGEMALAYPDTTRAILARGHTLGTHTWTHPLNLRRIGLTRATAEIERGFSAVALAAGQPIAPFFRFPGLSDSDAMLSHLQTRSIASFTVDVVSNDSFIRSPSRIAQRTLRLTESRKGGILLFHDIKSATAKALPTILAGLKKRGFKVVHLRAKAPMTPVTTFDKKNKATLAKREKRKPLLPFYGAVPPKIGNLAGEVPPTAELAPAARKRVTTPAPEASATRKAKRKAKRGRRHVRRKRRAYKNR
jgi:peptidoglycan-N-acetylglucosamine deacetylase